MLDVVAASMLHVGSFLRQTWCVASNVVWLMKPTFKEVPSETATGQVVCDVRGSADNLSCWMFVAASMLHVGSFLRQTLCVASIVVWLMKPTFKEVPSETATGQVVCDVRGSADNLSCWMLRLLACCMLVPFCVRRSA